MLLNSVHSERSFVVLSFDYYFLMLRRMPLGVYINKEDEWPG